MAIRIYKNSQANAVIFEGSTFSTSWNGLLTASVNGADSNAIDILNTAGTSGSIVDFTATGSNNYEYFRYPYTSFTDASGSAFASATEAVEYINSVSNRPASQGGFETNQSNFFINGNTTDFTVLAGVSQSINLGGSANDFNTYVPEDIPSNIYSTSSGLMHFNNLESNDVINMELGYFVNTDVADMNHSIKIEFTDNTGIKFSKSVQLAKVDSAAEDVEFLTTIPFYIGDNLINHPTTSVTASGEIFFTPDEDSDVKIKNITLYLTR